MTLHVLITEKKRPLYGITTQSLTDDESIFDKRYRGPYNKQGRRKSFLEKHKLLDTVIMIASGLIVAPIMLIATLEIFSFIVKIISL